MKGSTGERRRMRLDDAVEDHMRAPKITFIGTVIRPGTLPGWGEGWEERMLIIIKGKKGTSIVVGWRTSPAAL